jgi:tRNA (guanine-N7-)-methyltransferase
MTAGAGGPPPVRRSVHGRRHGRTLRAGQRAGLVEHLPAVAVPGADPAGNPLRHPVDLAALFGRAAPLWLEIGIGAGEHLIALAAANPQTDLIGSEIYVNGVAACLARLDRAGLGPGTSNVRIHAGDARDLLDVLPAGSVARAFLLYPDPWPKARHAKRRFVNPEGMDLVARALAPGARFHLATDIAAYVEHALAHMAGRGDFTRVEHDLHAPWPDWHRTRYEAKALAAGRQAHYLTWARV